MHLYALKIFRREPFRLVQRHRVSVGVRRQLLAPHLRHRPRLQPLPFRLPDPRSSRHQLQPVPLSNSHHPPCRLHLGLVVFVESTFRARLSSFRRSFCSGPFKRDVVLEKLDDIVQARFGLCVPGGVYYRKLPDVRRTAN